MKFEAGQGVGSTYCRRGGRATAAPACSGPRSRGTTAVGNGQWRQRRRGPTPPPTPRMGPAPAGTTATLQAPSLTLSSGHDRAAGSDVRKRMRSRTNFAGRPQQWAVTRVSRRSTGLKFVVADTAMLCVATGSAMVLAGWRWRLRAQDPFAVSAVASGRDDVDATGQCRPRWFPASVGRSTQAAPPPCRHGGRGERAGRAESRRVCSVRGSRATQRSN